MSLDAVKLLGINITISSKKEILEEIQKYLQIQAPVRPKSVKKSIKPRVIVTPNPEQIVLAQKNVRFREILNRADVALPDGVGIVWAGKIFAPNAAGGTPPSIRQTIQGISLMEELVKLAGIWGVPIALIGGQQGLAVKTLDCLSRVYPGLQGMAIDGDDVEIPGSESYFRALTGRIISEKTGMIFVGLGAPKQEFFIEQLSRHLTESAVRFPVVVMSVGGSFDEISGRLPRAPGWVSRIGVKWLWRLILEPWRISRQLALLQFIGIVLRERLFPRVG